MVDPLLVATPGHAALLLGNEAIVRGALEAGVGFATGYPGTPSSEVTDSFARISKAAGVAFEYAVNEKVCLELAFGASLAGARSICAMKHVGLMVAGDPLSTIPYMGVVGGMVIVSAGDPSCLTSSNEQDQRLLGRMLHFPVLDPSTPAEALELTLAAFEMSEECHLPVMIRITTRVAHSRAIVRYGPLRRAVVTGFVKDPSRLIPIPAHARQLRKELKGKLRLAQRRAEELFIIEGQGATAVLAAGAPAATVADVLAEQGLSDAVTLARVPCVHPLPEAGLTELLRASERLLVVEELSPFVEDSVRALAAREGIAVQVLGKGTDHFPEEFEYLPDVIRRGLHAGLGLGSPPVEPEAFEPPPIRPPVLCAGCPHRSTFFAARAAFGDDHLYFNDIGCYTLGFSAPLSAGDAVLCMGAGYSMAAGVARMTGKRTIGFLGDSTFFHAGMPPLLDAIKEDADMVAVVLDNRVTAMTGFQESPGLGDPKQPERTASIADVARALGAKHVEVFDPMDLPASIGAFERARDATGTSVLVAESPCPVHHARSTGAPLTSGLFQIDPTLCGACGRAGCGLECGQPTVPATERAMGRTRALSVLQPRPEAVPATAPCGGACPLGVCIQGYIGHVAAGEYDAALRMVMDRIPLPDSVCRVCHRPCEAVCVREPRDGAVAVNGIKRFVMDLAAGDEGPTYRPTLQPEHGRRVAVIGAGPAGLSAAHELRLRGYAVVLFDAAEQAGGLLRHGIPGFRLPAEAVDRDVQRILDLGVEFEPSYRLGRDLRLDGLLEASFDAVLLAVGAGRPGALPSLGPVADGPALTDALSFLANGGASAEGQRVIVIGGGNAGIDVARQAMRAGAATVKVLEKQPLVPADYHEVEAAMTEGVRLRPATVPVELIAGGLLCSGPGGHHELPADLVVIAVGQLVEPELLAADDLALDRDETGSIAADPLTCATSHPSVFAAGDVVAGGRTVTEAMAAGMRAAWGIDSAVRGAELADLRPPPPPPGAWPAPARAVPRDTVARRDPPELPPNQRGPTDEVVGAFTQEQARAEAERCLLCGSCGSCRACLDTFGCPAFFMQDGAIRIDPALCTGCGVCAAFCPNGAIKAVPGEQS